MFPGRPQTFRYQRRPADDCSAGLGGMAQDGGPRGGTFHGEMDRCRESQGWTTACNTVVISISSMPERGGKDQGQQRKKPRKRAYAGSLAIVDYQSLLIVARTCIIRTLFFGLQMFCCLFLTLRLFCF